jgi:hypothetical protein
MQAHCLACSPVSLPFERWRLALSALTMRCVGYPAAVRFEHGLHCGHAAMNALVCTTCDSLRPLQPELLAVSRRQHANHHPSARQERQSAATVGGLFVRVSKQG